MEPEQDHGDIVDRYQRPSCCADVRPGQRHRAAKRRTAAVEDPEHDEQDERWDAAAERWVMSDVYRNTDPSPDERYL